LCSLDCPDEVDCRYNWNLLVPVLSKFSVNVDADMKALLVAGDTELLISVLTELAVSVQAIDRRLKGAHSRFSVVLTPFPDPGARARAASEKPADSKKATRSTSVGKVRLRSPVLRTRVLSPRARQAAAVSPAKPQRAVSKSAAVAQPPPPPPPPPMPMPMPASQSIAAASSPVARSGIFAAAFAAALAPSPAAAGSPVAAAAGARAGGPRKPAKQAVSPLPTAGRTSPYQAGAHHPAPAAVAGGSTQQELHEFLAQSLAQALHVKPVAAAQLLSGNCRELANVLMLGLRNDFDPVVKWYQGLFSQVRPARAGAFVY
jgi:hypothetical protein